MEFEKIGVVGFFGDDEAGGFVEEGGEFFDFFGAAAVAEVVDEDADDDAVVGEGFEGAEFFAELGGFVEESGVVEVDLSGVEFGGGVDEGEGGVGTGEGGDEILGKFREKFAA